MYKRPKVVIESSFDATNVWATKASTAGRMSRVGRVYANARHSDKTTNYTRDIDQKADQELGKCPAANFELHELVSISRFAHIGYMWALVRAGDWLFKTRYRVKLNIEQHECDSNQWIAWHLYAIITYF